MKNMFKYFSTVLILVATITISKNSAAQVVPGAGGSLPTFTPFTPVANKFAGLIVRNTEREYNSFGGGTRAIVELRFPVPADFGGTSYTLQFSTNNGSSWSNYQYSGADLTTTGDNFSLNFPADYKLRLLLNGGPKNGYTSNEVDAPLSGIDTRFSGWGLDESMTLTGVIIPWVGRGLQASFTAKKISDNSDATGLSYQWYRVNPVTFQATIINTATNLLYATTEADAGHLMLIKASGDGINTGGFVQILSYSKLLIKNKASIEKITNTGFVLNLDKTNGGLTTQNLVLVDKNSNPVTITSVTAGASTAIYNIAATMDTAKAPYTLKNISDFWSIVSKGPMMMDDMQAIEFDYNIVDTIVNPPPTGVYELVEAKSNVYPVPANDFVNIESSTLINQVTIINSIGEVVVEIALNSNKYILNTSPLNSGIYFLLIVSANGIETKKIQISN